MRSGGKVLRLKVFRDIRSQKWMFLAVTVVLMLGIMLFLSFYLSYLYLSDTYQTFYTKTNFEDLSIEVMRVDDVALAKIRKIDGVLEVERRIAIDGEAIINGKRIPVKIISIPESQPKINRLYISEGEYSSFLVLEKFAEYYGLNVGNTMELEFGGNRINPRIGGLVYSPEYIMIVEEGSIVTSPGSYGVVFVKEDLLKRLGYDYNEVKIRVVSEDTRDEVLNRALSTLKGYGVVYYYISDNQPSKKLLEEDLKGFRSLAILFPSFFMIIAVFATYILLTRMIREQIGNIAVLRAMGLRRSEIVLHYLTYPVIIGFTATPLGVILGFMSASILTSSYIDFLNLPYYVSLPHYDIFGYSIVVGVLTPIISGFFVARNASQISIVQALRGYTEELYRYGFGDKLVEVAERLVKLNLLIKLSIRNVFRNRRRMIFSSFSIIASLILIMNSMVFVDSMDYVMDLEFNKILSYDIKVSLEDYNGKEKLKEIKKIKGVIEAHPVVEETILIEKGKTKAVMLVATDYNDLYNIYNERGEKLLPPKGIILPSLIAKNLSIVEGEKIKIYTDFGEREVEVVGIEKLPLMPVSYMSLEFYDGFNEIVVRVKEGSLEEVKSKVERIDGVRKVYTVQKAKEDMMELMGFFYAFIFFSLFFGASLGFSAIFNTTNISVIERRREFATLRMIGYTNREIAMSIFIENTVISIISIVVGLPIAYASAYGYYQSFQTELYYFPMVVYPRTYLISIIMIFAIVYLALIPAVKYISGMDISRVTKEVVG
ncbi:ABC transporter permease [Archaeoglobus sulfaticallidus]|nr:FtsX-like permease family protein [Archaeoglobus sulfaticallidus]